MTRRIAISAIKWNEEYHNAIKKGLAAAKHKYKDGLLIVVGYTIIGVKIAAIASGENISVQMYAPDLNIRPEAIDEKSSITGITVTSTTKQGYMMQMMKDVDGLIALDKGDPVVMAASRLKKPIWFPLSGIT